MFLLCFFSFFFFFFFSSRRRHTRSYGDWSSDVCSSDLSSWPGPGHDEPRVVPRLRDPAPHVEEDEEVLPALEAAEEQDDDLSFHAVTPEECLRAWPRPKAPVHPVGDDREPLGGDTELLHRLAASELAPDDDPIDRAHHPLLDERVEPAGIEVMVVRHDRHVEPVPPPSDQGRGPDVAQRVRAQQVEGMPVPDALDRPRHNEGRDRPPEAPPDGKPVDRPVRDTVRMSLVAREQDIDRHAAVGEVAQQLTLVRLASGRRLRIDAAVGGTDPHVRSSRAATSSMYGLTPKRR